MRRALQGLALAVWAAGCVHTSFDYEPLEGAAPDVLIPEQDVVLHPSVPSAPHETYGELTVTRRDSNGIDVDFMQKASVAAAAQHGCREVYVRLDHKNRSAPAEQATWWRRKLACVRTVAAALPAAGP